MGEVKTVGVKELKNKLSAYLREVRGGARILVSDRETVVAELHEPFLDSLLPASSNPKLSEWVRSGIIRLPAGEKRMLSPSHVSKPEGTSLKLLDRERGETKS